MEVSGANSFFIGSVSYDSKGSAENNQFLTLHVFLLSLDLSMTKARK